MGKSRLPQSQQWVAFGVFISAHLGEVQVRVSSLVFRILASLDQMEGPV